MIDIGTVQSALHAWAVRASALPSSSVIWADQNGPVPAAPCVILRFLSIDSTGQDWIKSSYTALGGLVETVCGLRNAELEVKCFGSAVGTQMPITILDRLIQARWQTSYQQDFESVGVGINDHSQPIASSGFEDSQQEPVAQCTFSLTLVSEQSESIGWIDTIAPPLQTA
jgi:hypothetical protein